MAVLDGIDLEIKLGEAVAVVGESGCGKSLLGLSAANLLPPTAEWTGTVEFRGQDVRAMSRQSLRRMRGAGIGVVYQDAMSSLNPGMTVSAQMRQVCGLGATSTPEELLTSVGLRDTQRILRSRPYQLSGGQRQRILIALALARDPDLIIADEPTTALDVTVQRQVIELLQSLRSSRQFAMLFVSHDLALVSQFASRVVILYAGQIVESGPTRAVLANPRHPYTAGLLQATVSLEERRPTLAPIPGQVRTPAGFLSGCRFRERCARADEACATRPALKVDGARRLACYHPVTSGASPETRVAEAGEGDSIATDTSAGRSQP
ncbi:ABC transporter ATP-binding protein [Jiangella asiatica]|uniref:ABC transporter ATP-binding protein n=1 Tax=Jiangella asiatica TaxID=2530372 RepID=UPI0013A5F0AF|nr:ABC transporter ATP-binding protein [Jiangella asiatica]